MENRKDASQDEWLQPGGKHEEEAGGTTPRDIETFQNNICRHKKLGFALSQFQSFRADELCGLINME